MVCSSSGKSSESHKPERRNHPRTQVSAEIQLHVEGTRFPLRVKAADISLGGVYAEMMFTLEVGTKLKIVLSIDNEEVSADGFVVTRHLQIGNGIEFTHILPEDRARLQQFLNARS